MSFFAGSAKGNEIISHKIRVGEEERFSRSQQLEHQQDEDEEGYKRVNIEGRSKADA